MDKFYWLNQIQIQDRAQVGDKAFYLSQLMQHGYPVLPGFAIASEIFREFLANLNSSEALVADLPYSSLHLNVDNWRQLQQVSQQLRREVLTAEVSSQLINNILQATQAWNLPAITLRPSLVMPKAKVRLANLSGLLESIVCRPEPEAIAQGLKESWSQLFRARSLLYWQRAKINLQEINLAVLVQPVYNAIASGLLNANDSHWEIQATWGLGVAITQGEISPDIYRIQKENPTVIEQQLGNKILAYGVVEPEEISTNASRTTIEVDNPCLTAYLLESAQQQQYALSAEQLQQIIDTGEQLVDEVGNNFTLEWSIGNVNATPQLYLTQISTAQSVATPNFQMIQGLGAATGRETATAYVILEPEPKPEQIPPGVILIAPEILPYWLPIAQKALGIVTEKGGLTSHAAILARELGIPAIVSAKDATTIIQSGEQLLIDGDRGEVYRLGVGKRKNRGGGAWGTRSPSPSPSQLPGEAIDLPENSTSDLHLSPHPYITATKLLLNLSQSSLVEQVCSLPVDGVGLLRSEMMALSILEGQHPRSWLEAGRTEQLLESWRLEILKFVRAFTPKPVFYRSLDWRSQELLASNQLPSSKSASHPMLGERGTFSYLTNSQLFELELQALATLQKTGYKNICLILPFVRTVEEFIFCRQKVESAGLTQIPEFQLWIMAEVPSVLFLLPEYVKAGVQGISIGTNDLTQLLLGIDREQGVFAKKFDQRHPVVIKAISQLIHMARDAGIPCSICGQAPALYPEIIEKLIEWGITSISVEPEAFTRTQQAIARAEQKLILEAARQHLNRDR
ncbi:MAG: PEP/pyruvate-binding domain-containing protein [Calothrix sp. MO_167.B42]|nr:PEP/pyruvate-binding domain-containing protein [Calothrix sp. MO_167.B42]